jgi:hypothetical protein
MLGMEISAMRIYAPRFAALLLACATMAPAQAQLKSPVYYSVGSEPQVVVAAGFNNDEAIDLATADFSSNDVSILLGNGDGTFQKARQFSTTLGPSALGVADFNGDGIPDLAVTEYGFNSSTLQIFLGNGDGTFTAGASYTNVSDPYDVTVADFNGDGHPDLAIANNGTNVVSVMLGRGDGTFGKAHNYTVPLPERVIAADVNGDNHPDLAVLAYCGRNVQVCKSGAVAILLNDGTGKFSKPAYYSVKGVGPDGVTAADLNHDGRIDLVVANNNFQQPSIMSVLNGNGDGTFGHPVHYNVGAGPAGVALTDINGDGKLDAAVANTAGTSLSMLFGKGNGRFKSAKTIAFPSNSLPISVTAADFNGDQAPDLAVALSYANEVAVLLNKR